MVNLRYKELRLKAEMGLAKYQQVVTTEMSVECTLD